MMERMNKEAYLNSLKSKLQGMDEDEIEDALHYVSEYFDEAGEGNEETVLKDLGSPSKFAATLKADAISKGRTKADEKVEFNRPKSGVKKMITVFLGICAMPIALPLMLVVVTLMFAFICVVIGFSLASLISLVACLLAGIPLVVRGFFLFDSTGNALISFGGGLLSIGLGIMLSVSFYQLVRWMVPCFTNCVIRIYERVRGGRSYEK